MSSVAIAGQIASCQHAIRSSEQKIAEMKVLIENQENEVSSFKKRKISFEDFLHQKKQRKTNISNISSEMTIANKYSAHMDSVFEKESTQLEYLENIDKKIEFSLSKNRDLLYQLKNELSALQIQLASLNTEYHAAISREAEEAAQAALAAQSQNIKK